MIQTSLSHFYVINRDDCDISTEKLDPVTMMIFPTCDIESQSRTRTTTSSSSSSCHNIIISKNVEFDQNNGENDLDDTAGDGGGGYSLPEKNDHKV